MKRILLPVFLAVSILSAFSSAEAKDELAFRKASDKSNTDYFIPLVNVTNIDKTQRGVLLQVDNEKVAVDFIRSDIVRFKITQNGVFDEKPTFAVIKEDFGPVRFGFIKTDKELTLSTEDMRVVINLEKFNYDIFRTDGSIIVKSVQGKSYMSLGDLWAVTRFKTSGDSFLGFGEKTAYLNHNGQYLQMWNADMYSESYDAFRDPGVGPIEGAKESWFNLAHDPMYIDIPLYYHIPAGNDGKASASFIDNGYHLRYNLTVADTLSIVCDGGQMTEYFFAGPEIKTILSEYTELTGRMKAPPLWTIGHHQCRWYPYVEKDIKDLADNYRTKSIPNDVFWLDIDYMNGYRVFTWDNKKFPDPLRLSKEMNARGFQMVTIIDPGVKYDPGYKVYDEGLQRNLFCKTVSGKTFLCKVWPGLSAFPDFTRQEVRDWWAGWISSHTLGAGLGGIWIDMNEPAIEKAPREQMRFDRDGANWEHDRYHNQFGFLMAWGTEEGLRKARPGMRTFVLSRSGFAGIQRHSANWTGDNPITWGQFGVNIPMNCALGMCGQPFTGSDIRSGEDEELFIRWYQYAIFYPFCRNHSGDYPWTYGDKAEKQIKKSIDFRYSILPYIYSCFIKSSLTGEPIMRPMVFDFQKDLSLRNTSDQFMFGNNILVAPIIEKGALSRKVILPEGNWYLYGKPGAIAGGKTITADAPIDVCPVYAREGSVIASIAPIQTTTDYKPKEIILNVYIPAGDGEWKSVLYEDDGISEKYLEGERLTTEFTVKKTGGKTILTAKVEGKKPAGFQREKFIIRTIGKTVKDKTISNNGKGFSIKL